MQNLIFSIVISVMGAEPADSIFVARAEIAVANLCFIWLALLVLPFGRWWTAKMPQESRHYDKSNNIDSGFWFTYAAGNLCPHFC
jgi:hypothetical protein